MALENEVAGFSPGGSSLSSLSIDLGNLSIDTSSPLHGSRADNSENIKTGSNLSTDDLNVSIAYSLSFEDLEVEPKSYHPSSKRKLRKTPKLSTDSGYSPLATNILNIQNSTARQKRFSEFFRAELSNLNLNDSGNSPASFSISKDNLENLSLTDSNKSVSCNNFSLDPDKENMSGVSVKNRSARYSEYFRSEASQLHLSSPDISFDLPDSPKNKDLSLALTSSSRETSQNEEAPESVQVSPQKTRSFSEHFKSEVSQLQLSSPDISFDIPESPRVKDLSLELTESSRENSVCKSNQDKNVKNVRLKKESDEDGPNFVTPARCKRNMILESSDEEDIENANSTDVHDVIHEPHSWKRESDTSDIDDDKYDSSFIDDEALEGEETASEDESEAASEDESEAEAVLTSESSDSNDDQNTSVDEYVTPPNVVKETPFFTPRKNIKTPNPTNLYKTPSTFCHSPITPASKTDRRRTCLATPLSVKTKTGTPGLPNRTYNKNLLNAARELFEQFNEFVFGNQLPRDLEIKINKRLNTTAGRCVYMRKGDLYKAHIELSPKVVDCLERLKETLAHELCHAATFIIDKKMDNHGPIWKRWARRVNLKYPELPPVSRCHSYQIQYKYNYHCSEEWCNYTIGRHSKSIDLERARCPLCYSRLTLPISTQTTGKTPNKWTEFVKSRYNEVKGDQPPRTPHKDLMKILSEEFKEMKMKNTV